MQDMKSRKMNQHQRSRFCFTVKSTPEAFRLQIPWKTREIPAKPAEIFLLVSAKVTFWLRLSRQEGSGKFLLEEENEKMEKLRHEKIAFLFFSCYLRTFENRERQRQGTFMLPLMFSRSIHSYNDSINFNLCCDVDSACWLQNRSSTGARRTDTHTHTPGSNCETLF